MINSLEEFVNAFTTSLTRWKDKLAYRFWQPGQVPKLPYCVYYERKSDNFKADNKVYRKGSKVIVELYTKNKSVRDEAYLESFLDNHDMPWDKTEQYIDDEELYMVYYEINI